MLRCGAGFRVAAAASVSQHDGGGGLKQTADVSAAALTSVMAAVAEALGSQSKLRGAELSLADAGRTPPGDGPSTTRRSQTGENE